MVTETTHTSVAIAVEIHKAWGNTKSGIRRMHHRDLVRWVLSHRKAYFDIWSAHDDLNLGGGRSGGLEFDQLTDTKVIRPNKLAMDTAELHGQHHPST